MSLQNLPERFLYERLPEGLISLDERTLIWSVVSGYQDRIEDLRAYAKKFQLFFSSLGLPETGPNVVLVDLQSDAGKAYTRSLDITPDTPADGSSALAAWAAQELNIETDAVSNARYGVDALRLVDANILDYLATNIGAVLYKSGINENLPTLVNSSGTFTAEQLAHQKLIETYFPRLKFKGTAKSFEQLAKLMGFDDLRMVPLWQRVSLRLPNDPGSSVNDPDFSQIPEYWPRQDLGPFYDPLNQSDGPFYAWAGTASAGTAATNFYTQAVNGFQPYVKVTLVGTANGTGAIEHPASGTYALSGGAPHQKASVTAGALYFQALGEGQSWNGITVDVFTVANGTLRGIGVSDRLSSIKYRSSFFDLSLALDPDRADATFGTLTARRNKDLALAPHAYQSFVNVLTAVSPYRPFTSGTLTVGQTPFDFLVPFSGTVVAVAERVEAGLTDYQINYTEMAKAAAQVTQALEEVRAATRFPRRSTVGWLSTEQVEYAPYVESTIIGSVSSGSITSQFTGTFAQAPLPPYTADVEFFSGSTTLLSVEAGPRPEALYYRGLRDQGTITGQIVFSGSGSNSYDFLVAGTFPSTGTLSAHFTVTSSEVVRPDAWMTSYGTGTWTYAVIGDYGLDIPSVHEDQRPTAAMVHSWNPVAIFSTGDNNYYNGLASEIARNNFAYHEDIRIGRFFPALGNHDFTGGTDPSVGINYFFNGTVPNNGRYYNVRRGNVEWFCLDDGLSALYQGGALGDPYYSSSAEPDGNSYLSTQGKWLKQKLAESTAPWKIVYLHHGPFHSATTSSNYYPGYPRLRWPFKEWGATVLFNGHVHAYERINIDGFNYITIGVSGENNRTFTTPVYPGSQFRFGPGADTSGYGAVRVRATDSWLLLEFMTVDGAIRDVVRYDNPRKYQARPEDDTQDLVFETADEYPWRRDIVGGGELVDIDYYTTGTDVQAVSILEQTTSVKDQTGAEYSVYVIKGSGTNAPRFTQDARSTQPYTPGQPSVAFEGSFRDQSNLEADDLEPIVDSSDPNNYRTLYSRTDLDTVFNPGYKLYHAGLVGGVLVADPVSFNGEHHRMGLVGWLPFNEHPDDDLAVSDRASSLAITVLEGIQPGDRLFDATMGRYMLVSPGRKVTGTGERNLCDELTIAFWLKCNPGTGVMDIVVRWGLVKFELNFATKMFIANLDDGNGNLSPLGNTTLTGWQFVYIRKDAMLASFGYGDMSTLTEAAAVTGPWYDNASDDQIEIISPEGGCGFAVRDLRVWNVKKTAAQMSKVWKHSPVPTEVQYRIGHVLCLNQGDRYGLQVLPTGWIIPASMPAWVRSPKFARVVRYDGRGEYVGESRFKEVGLAGGQVPPYTYTLGQVGYELTADGTTVVSTQHGALPGHNAWWDKDATGSPGFYIQLSGSNSSGSIPVSTLSGSGVSPWPNPMEATNPFQDRIWVKGQNGTIYEVGLEAYQGGAAWVAKETGWQGTVQQATGALTSLVQGPIGLSVTNYGSVCQTTVSGTGTTPPVYLYLHENLLENVAGAETLARWTDPSTFGLQVGAPALQESGELSFENSAPLAKGTYKLLLDGGNIGKVDQEFDGYKLEITVGDTVVQRTFLSGFKGSDFRSQEEFEIEVENEILGDWLLTLSWSNSASDPLRGTKRQLVIYGYNLRKLQTTLWRGTIADFGTTPGLAYMPISGAWTTTPGGWLAEYNAYGTVQHWQHEGTIYPANDTMVSKFPLANQLTGVTERRREDILVLANKVTSSAFFNLLDIADPVITAFGTDTALG